MDEFRGVELARMIAGGCTSTPTARWVEHPYGASRVPAQPRRVVTLGLDEHELLLHLGIVPVLVRDEWGDQPSAVWPWARHLLGGHNPATFPRIEIPFARLHEPRPDLIVATWAGIDQQTYDELSTIAPTLPNRNDAEYPWDQPWDDHLLELADAFGMRRRAQALVDGVRTRMMAIADAHPHWRSLVAASVTMPETAFDVDLGHRRGRLLQEIGLGLPTDLATSTSAIRATVAADALNRLDRDVIVWVNGSDDPRPIVELPERTRLTAHREGREVYLDKLHTAAFSVQSPLSLHFLLDMLVPEIEAAVDGVPVPPVAAAARYGIAPSIRR